MSTLQTFIINVRFNSYPSYNIDGIENLPQIYFAFQIANFSIRSNKEEFLMLRTLSIDAKVFYYLYTYMYTYKYINDFSWKVIY